MNRNRGYRCPPKPKDLPKLDRLNQHLISLSSHADALTIPPERCYQYNGILNCMEPLVYECT